ncbi:MAG: phospholipase D-like domain-containing protein [Cellvibrionaceae bacterium]
MQIFDDLEQQLSETLEDGRLTASEKQELQKVVAHLDLEKLNFFRNQAFAISRDKLANSSEKSDVLSVMRWLERVIKIIDSVKNKMITDSSVHFSPGDDCRSKLIELCQQSKMTVDICVYTISDNYLTEAIIEAHHRGLSVRVITDNAKSEDLGSDIDLLMRKNVPLVMDASKYHMHHKFAIFDKHYLANGSFNWTRSATTSNEENIVVATDPFLVDSFVDKFNELWNAYN